MMRKTDIIINLLTTHGVSEEDISELKVDIEGGTSYIIPIELETEVKNDAIIVIADFGDDIPLFNITTVISVRNNKNIPAIYKLINSVNKDSIVAWSYDKEEKMISGKFTMYETDNIEIVDTMIGMVGGCVSDSINMMKEILQ